MSDSTRPTEYLSIAEAARELRVCRSTIKSRIKDETIQAIKFGRRTLIPRAAILSLGGTA